MKRLFTLKPKYSFRTTAFKINIYVNPKVIADNYLHIISLDRTMDIKLRGFAYQYLLQSANKGNQREIEAFATMLYVISHGIYRDGAFAEEVLLAIKGYTERLLKQGEEEASKVTDSEEMANQSFIEDSLAYGQASGKQRKRMRKEWIEAVDAELSHGSEEEA